MIIYIILYYIGYRIIISIYIYIYKYNGILMRITDIE